VRWGKLPKDLYRIINMRRTHEVSYGNIKLKKLFGSSIVGSLLHALGLTVFQESIYQRALE
jgi:hypothetical protein